MLDAIVADLDEILWNSGPDGSSVSTSDWECIVEHIFGSLAVFLQAK